jgi:hypothetical protein
VTTFRTYPQLTPTTPGWSDLLFDATCTNHPAALRAAGILAEPGGLACDRVTDTRTAGGVLHGHLSEHRVEGGALHDPAAGSSAARARIPARPCGGGNGNDLSAEVTGHISVAMGSFESVTGVSTETGTTYADPGQCKGPTSGVQGDESRWGLIHTSPALFLCPLAKQIGMIAACGVWL